jgi:hypothetical protein
MKSEKKNVLAKKKIHCARFEAFFSAVLTSLNSSAT